MNEKDRWGAIGAAAIDLHCALKAEREAAIEVERLVHQDRARTAGGGKEAVNGPCAICGCDEFSACELSSGRPCYWIAPNLCVACLSSIIPCAHCGKRKIDHYGSLVDKNEPCCKPIDGQPFAGYGAPIEEFSVEPRTDDRCSTS